jgi:hypothetical protein
LTAAWWNLILHIDLAKLDNTQHQLLFAELAIVNRLDCYKIGNSNNNEILIINLAAVSGGRIFKYQFFVKHEPLVAMAFDIVKSKQLSYGHF